MAYAQRMINTRRGAVLLSALAALLAGALVLVYVARYRSSVKAEGAPVTVLIAKSPIAKGTSGAVIASGGLYSATTIRQSQLQNGAISDASALANKVATHDIYPGAQLTSTDFAAAASNIAASITGNQRIVSVPFDQAHGLLADLQAGDYVDIYAGFNVTAVNAQGIPTGGGQARPVLRMIMSGIQVARVGGKGTSGAANVEFKVNDLQATKLAFASDNGKLWIALRPSAGAKTSPPSIVSAETLLLGVPPVAVLHSFGGKR